MPTVNTSESRQYHKDPYITSYGHVVIHGVLADHHSASLEDIARGTVACGDGPTIAGARAALERALEILK